MTHRLALVIAVGLCLCAAFPAAAQEDDVAAGSSANPPASAAEISKLNEAFNAGAGSSGIDNSTVDVTSADANQRAVTALQLNRYADAVKWAMISSKQGDPNGETLLGYFYQAGFGVAVDYGEALRLYELAAAKGLAKAECNLGQLYEYGRGVSEDYKQAFYWYGLAASQGWPNAQFAIGMLYAQGKGLTLDLQSARIWMERASSQGFGPATDWLTQHPT